RAWPRTHRHMASLFFPIANPRFGVQRRKKGSRCNGSAFAIVSLRTLAWNHRCSGSTRSRWGSIILSASLDASESESALSTKAPVDPAARQHDAGHMPTELLFQRGAPGHELEAQPIVDHREPA